MTYEKKQKGVKLFMRNLAKGSVLFTLLALSVVFFYSQTPVGAALFSQESVNVAQLTSFNLQSESKESVAGFVNAGEALVESAESVDTEEAEDGADNEESASAGMAFSATCYCLKGRTATGAGVRRGIVAADPRILPLGTRISISGSSHSGTYLVADTGGVIKGRIIDIWVPSCAEAIRFGRKRITVTVLGKGGKKATDTKKDKTKVTKKSDKTKTSMKKEVPAEKTDTNN
jgi:3D (Asp-Asp-Asp) domain-containing protein